MIRLILLFTLAATSLFTGGQPVTDTTRGVVIADGKPLAGVSVVPEGKRRGTITDESGRFALPGLTGKLKLHFSAIGFIHQSKDFMPGSAKTFEDTITLIADSRTLDDVVVSGTMRAVSKMESPISVEVYTPVLFNKNPTPNIFESLSMVNGVQPQLNCNVCNTGDIHINGMEGPYTMILIDGMPIVSSLSTVYGLSGIPNSLVKRIEIVKGPASTLYGSEAVGGLINIITKEPASAARLRVDFSGTSIGEYNTDVSTGFKVGNATALLGINYFNYWNKRDINNDNFTDVALQNRFSIFNKWAFRTRGQKLASLAARYVHEDRWGGEMQWNNKLRGSNQVYGESILTNRVEFIGNYGLNAHLSADISYNYHLQDSYYGDTKYYAKQHVAFGQLRWAANYGRHDLLIGLPLRFTSYDDNSPATAVNGVNRPDRVFLPGIFVQDELKASEKVTTLVGLRFDHHNAHGGIVTPRVAVKWSPNLNNTLRLSGGNGYRVVNLFTEDHSALTGARDVVITEKLRPEQSWNVNLNYTSNFKSAAVLFSYDASVFYTYFSNKIIGDFITDPRKIIYDNLDGHAISKGVSLNTDLSIAHRLKLNAGVTVMDVFQVERDATGKLQKIPQLFAPKFSGTWAASYSFPRYALTFDWTGRLNGPMHLPVVPGDYRPGMSPTYCIMNLQATKNFGGTFEVYGGIKNLLNFLPSNPLLHPDDPFNKASGKYFDANGVPRPETNPNGYTFDPSYNYAPIQGARIFVGMRWTVTGK
ncbi:TonB-dependent receptor [Segetibacter sp. 3557_3]|uniref:TonB-dependent receptor n=1 Tax=Segetibacter sp. 3557_3 TaxID=2547429 RepID=UPI001058A690|nr:TonB-dependent receptor [Segetibacter sp. 3557_3]TDH26112.1 TonB-dependent receptor [Segetibacter sp. 3557_3]